MDKIDKKILNELDLNPKLSLSKLAKKVGKSQQTVDYRITRLIKNKDILKFGAIINLKSLGYEQYRIFITFNKKNFSNKEIFSYLEKQKGVYWAARIGGKYDLHLTLFVREIKELDEFIEQFNNNFPDLIKNIKSEYVLNHIFYNHKFLSKRVGIIEYGYDNNLEKIDNLDKEILKEIKDFCRLSSLKISENKKTTYKTIINRIKNLEKKKVILGYRMFIKSKEMKPYIVLVSFKNYSKNQEKNFIKNLEQNNSVTQVLRLFGNWNYYLHIRTENNEKLQDILIDLRDKYSIIDTFEIIPIFEDMAINLYPF